MVDILITESPELQGNFEIETLEGIEECRDNWTVYSYNGVPVPRMTELLKECIGKEYLVAYALRCKDYYTESNQTLYIGTLVHELIDEFLITGTVDMSKVNFMNESIFNKVTKAYNNFVRWYNDMIAEGYTIETLEIEKKVCTPWYAGTIDWIARITEPGGRNSSVLVLDFKTSTKIATDYLVQTYGYMWAVNWNILFANSKDYPHIDGIGIIRVDKKSKKYETVIIKSDNLWMNNIHNAFVSCLNWFYYQKNLAHIIKDCKE